MVAGGVSVCQAWEGGREAAAAAAALMRGSQRLIWGDCFHCAWNAWLGLDSSCLVRQQQ